MAYSVKDKKADHNSQEVDKEKKEEDQESEALEDFLKFDAHLLASKSSGEVEKGDFLQSIEEQYSNESIVEENDERGKIVKNQQQEMNEIVDEDSELDYTELDSDSNSVLVNLQNDKISQIENELSVLKKMLAVQLDIDHRLNRSNTVFKIISVFGIILASFALSLHFWERGVNAGNLILSGDPLTLVVDIKEDTITPANYQRDDIQPQHNPQPLAVEKDISKPEKILVEPEDDISDISTADRQVKVEKGDSAPVKGWVVNLNSYEQLWEADQKIEELKVKGIVTEMIIVNVKGVRWYRIRITGFQTKAEADLYAATIKDLLKVNHAWVSKL